MLLSMTGYGRADDSFESKKITVEVRSLNSKFTDLRIKLPQNYKEKEQDLNKLAANMVERGKIEISIEIQSISGDEEFSLNVPLFKKYHVELSKLSDELGLDKTNLLPAILRMPQVLNSTQQSLDEGEWEIVKKTFLKALENFNAFRRQEGMALESDLSQRISNIQTNLEALSTFEKERIEKIKTRMKSHLDEYLGKENVDQNRFEQEVLFYMEKIDINEEKVRLSQHCKYFLELLNEKATLKGRKLNFIGQEIGREINTLGSKAYSSAIQIHVVNMKDELEKIKEQVANSV